MLLDAASSILGIRTFHPCPTDSQILAGQFRGDDRWVPLGHKTPVDRLVIVGAGMSVRWKVACAQGQPATAADCGERQAGSAYGTAASRVPLPHAYARGGGGRRFDTCDHVLHKPSDFIL